MPKLIVVSGQKVVKKFEKIGYKVVRQTGSHMRMWNFFDKNKKPLTIPNHKLIGRGLLRKIVRDAEITVEEFNNL
jgi:predicted RNA binding protein YcfA (HicA-like mRNA interferase family)